MTEQKALELLDLEPGASASEIRRAYQEIYNELQIRLTNAPTEHQKELYRKRLAAVEEAYLFLGGESEEDLSELPSMGPVENTSEEKAQAFKPQHLSEAAALELLGISKPFSRGKLIDAYKDKKEGFEKGIKVAPNNEIKNAFQKSLVDLENAFSLLEPLAERPTPVPPKPEPSKSKPEKKKASPLLWAIPALLFLAAGIWFYLTKGEKRDEISQEVKEEFIKVKSQADLLAEKQYWDQALEKYEEAYGLLADTEVGDSMRSIGQRLEAMALDAKAEEQALAWAIAQRANSTSAYEDFINKYPSGTYTAQAEQKIRDLEANSERKAAEQQQRWREAEEQRRRDQAEVEEQTRKKQAESDRRITEEAELLRREAEVVSSKPIEEVTNEIYDKPEVLPTFPGGLASFSHYLSNNLVYPTLARNIGVEGIVYVKLIIDTDGSIQDVELLKGIGAGCDEEAIRVVQNSPKWNPGMVKGRPVKVRMNLPIRFKLS
ncbi:energy transducer TonB [Cecembia lonarensis]|uniref:Gram-negative bacterial tonB protein n=1 Tax=Cecembia lonarensis (strain CCUG 58316 / KCTC 22772 / LW9) TaxID=1225176 RepID=K1M4D8_CECL9|nr:energy transducer TonB [Cecembia lonarensis]EKB51119.1 Gram-negative bacterial tonB protein [Cecembia lonarensis LW9]